MKVRAALFQDITSIVSIHCLAFPGFLMTLLGEKFLTTYYQLVLKYPKHICFVGVDDSDIIQGFVVGFNDPNLFYSNFRREKFRLILAALTSLAFRPQLWHQVVYSWLRATSLAKDYEYGEHGAELASIAVNPSIKGNGLGKKLVYAFLVRASEMNTTSTHLTTDANSNEATNNFYLSLGFQLEHTFLAARKRLMNHYVYNIK